LIWALTYV